MTPNLSGLLRLDASFLAQELAMGARPADVEIAANALRGLRAVAETGGMQEVRRVRVVAYRVLAVGLDATTEQPSVLAERLREAVKDAPGRVIVRWDERARVVSFEAWETWDSKGSPFLAGGMDFAANRAAVSIDGAAPSVIENARHE